MARIPKPSTPKKSVFAVHTVTLTPDVVEILQRLSQEATDFLGRAVSSSAIVRALVRQIDQQGPPAQEALFILVEKEMKDGRLWGKKK
jgi:hypothetical protein